MELYGRIIRMNRKPRRQNSIVATICENDGDVELHTSIALSPNSALVLLNMLKEWGEYAIEA